VQTFPKANPVQIQSPDDYQNLMGTSTFKDISMMKFHVHPVSFSRDVSQTGKMPRFNVEESLKKFLGLDLDTRWFQKFYHFLLIHRYISYEIFTSNLYLYVKLLRDNKHWN